MMLRTLRLLRVVQWSMLASIVLYVAVGELARPPVRLVNPSLSYMFTTLAVALVGVIFVVRRTMVARPGLSLAAQADDLVSLNQWRTGYIVTYALCEGLALLGLVQRFLGSSLQQSAPYYFGGFVLMLFFWPRQPESTS
jgi:F0F1-type ATP synthase membrane subunit c/vacuolar-type H+-ATPase subunit K